MEKIAYKFRVLTTYQSVEEAALFYYETSDKYNPFLFGLGLDKETLYQELMKDKVQTIADQQLSIGMYDESTGELLAAIICVDGTTEFTSEPKNKLLRARAALFKEGRDRIRQEEKVKPKYGELIEGLIGATNPKYMKLNFAKLAQGALIKHHIQLGYQYQYGDLTTPSSQYLYELMEVPFLRMRMYLKDFEFEGEKVFANLDFGKEYSNGMPFVLFYYISYDNLIEGGYKVYNKIKERISPRL